MTSLSQSSVRTLLEKLQELYDVSEASFKLVLNSKQSSEEFLSSHERRMARVLKIKASRSLDLNELILIAKLEEQFKWYRFSLIKENPILVEDVLDEEILSEKESDFPESIKPLSETFSKKLEFNEISDWIQTSFPEFPPQNIEMNENDPLETKPHVQSSHYYRGNLPPRSYPVKENSRESFRTKGAHRIYDAIPQNEVLNIGMYAPQVYPELIAG